MKKVLPICLSFLLILWGAVFSYGQTPGVSSSEFNPLDDIQVPSPNATAFVRHVENPVGLYTGSVDVRIPVYTLPATRGLSVPIDLSYAKGGIKVDELASDVGLGWVLNGGGVISRTVKGEPDETPVVGYLAQDLSNYTNGSGDQEQYILANDFPNVDLDGLDTQPDEFYFSFPGGGGRFVLSRNDAGDVVATPIPHQDIMIEFDSDSEIGMFASWVLTMPNGVKYYFGGVDEDNTPLHEISETINTCQNGSSDNPSTPVITSWYLRKIVAPDGLDGSMLGVVKYNYMSSAPIEYFVGMSQTRYVQEQVNLVDILSNGNPILPGYTFNISDCGLECEVPPAPEGTSRCDLCAGNSMLGMNTCVQLSQVSVPLHLSEIKSDLGSIKIIYETGRQDLTNGVMVDKIEVYRNYQLIRTLDLVYDYFATEAPLLSGLDEQMLEDLSPNSANNLISDLYYRLKLKEVRQLSAEGNELPPYKLFYWDESDGEQGFVLPPRLSYRQDYWGYANNNLSRSLLPPILTHPLLQTGADRCPNVKLSKAGMLKKIYYPEGGSTEFKYEPHFYSSIGVTLSPPNDPSDSLFLVEISKQMSIDTCEEVIISNGPEPNDTFCLYAPEYWEKSFEVYCSTVELNLTSTLVENPYPDSLNSYIKIFKKTAGGGLIYPAVYTAPYGVNSVQLTLDAGEYVIEMSLNSEGEASVHLTYWNCSYSVLDGIELPGCMSRDSLEFSASCSSSGSGSSGFCDGIVEEECFQINCRQWLTLESLITGYSPVAQEGVTDFVNAGILLLDESGELLYSFYGSLYSDGEGLDTTESRFVLVEPGNYCVQFYLSGVLPADSWINFEAKLIYTDCTNPEKATLAGGVRVREIVQDDGLGNEVIRTYHYDHPEQEEGVSSGVLISRPIHGLSVLSVSQSSCLEQSGNGNSGGPQFLYSCGVVCAIKGQFSSSQVPLGVSQGSHVVYQYVEELKGHDGQAGKTRYKFSFYPDELDLTYPVIPWIRKRDHLRGKLLEESMYKKLNSGGFEIVQQTKNVYELIEQLHPDVLGLDIQVYPPVSINCPLKRFLVQSYFHESNWFRLKSTTQIKDGVEVKTEMSYNAAAEHTNPIASTFTNSDGSVYTTHTKYAHEVDNACLLGRFMTSVPIETTVSINGVMVGGKRIEFAAVAGGMCKPVSYFAYYPDDGGWVNRYSVSYYEAGENGGNPGMPKTFEDVECPDKTQTLTWSAYDRLDMKAWHAWIWDYDYNGLGLPEKVTNPDGQFVNYSYDDFQRLQLMVARGGGIETSFDYVYALGWDTGEANYIRSTTTYSDAPSQEVREYSDGLGRPLQKVLVGYGPQGEDVVQEAVLYDAAGRVYQQYLPFAGNGNGEYTSPSGPVVTLIYEASPLDRVLKNINPDGSSTEVEYGANTDADEVIYYPAQNGSTPLVQSGFYAAGILYKQIAKDENGYETITFTDKAGRTILVRRKVSDGEGGVLQNVDTYTVYDQKSRISKVIAPDGTEYQYTYDERNRMISKVVPSGGVTNMTYDLCGNLESTTTPNGDVISNVYDEYMRLTTASLNGQSVIEKEYGNSGMAIDKLVEERSRVLLPDGSLASSGLGANPGFLTTTYTYDDYGRVVNNSVEYLSDEVLVIDRNATTYNMADWVLSIERLHSGYTGNYDIYLVSDYDHAGRLFKTSMRIDCKGPLNNQTEITDKNCKFGHEET